jgi:ATP-dependent Clp protease ATP-binding subunit ClpA
MGHDRIGTEHLLLGLLGEDESAACSVLRDAGLDRERAREACRRVVRRGPALRDSGHIPFTRRAKQTLERSLRESITHGSRHVGTEHLLLALCSMPSGGAHDLLAEAGVESEAVCSAVLAAVGPGGARRSQPGLSARPTDAAVLRAMLAAEGAGARLLRRHGIDEAAVDALERETGS